MKCKMLPLSLGLISCFAHQNPPDAQPYHEVVARGLVARPSALKGTDGYEVFARISRVARYWISDVLPARTVSDDVGNYILPVTELRASKYRVAIVDDKAEVLIWIEAHALKASVGEIVQLADRSGMAHKHSGVWLKPGVLLQQTARSLRLTEFAVRGESLDATGWVPDTAIARLWRRNASNVDRNSPPLAAVASSARIFEQPDGQSRILATFNQNENVRELRRVGKNWREIEFESDYIVARGFVRSEVIRTDTPNVSDSRSRVVVKHRSGFIPKGTCLFAGATGEIIGSTRTEAIAMRVFTSGWWTLDVDAPWGKIAVFLRENVNSQQSTRWQSCLPAAQTN